MGRPSKLSAKQRLEIAKRLSQGEKPADLAAEYDVSRSLISSLFQKRAETVKAVANQLVAADTALRNLDVSDQLLAVSLADELRAISMHLAGAGKYGAATAHRLSGIAHSKVQEIDDAAPLTAESLDSLKGVAVLTKMANEAAVIPTALLTANKDMVRDMNTGAAQSKDELLREIAANLPN
jgi:hypothetical protein